MGVFVRHEPCPKCGSRDNLARYADGSAFCFGRCGYKERANRVPAFTPIEEKEDGLQLSLDLCSNFPRHVVEWLAQYDISVPEALKHGWKYDPYRNQLVFIFYDGQGSPILTQARNFREGAKKYFTDGDVQDVLPIFRSAQGDHRRILVVEDVVSAAKIARQCDAIPCLGSYLSKLKQTRLRLLGYSQMGVWLDEDKLLVARQIADEAKWVGFETKVIYTNDDPKCHNDTEIGELINGT